MKKLLATTCLVFALTGLGAPSKAQDACGEVTIASFNSLAAEVLASLDKLILTHGFGCDAQTITGDTVPTVTSMIERAQPDIMPEGWIENAPAIFNPGIESGKLVVVGPAVTDGGLHGWYIPKYVADAHPEIKTFADALEHPEVFPSPEDSSKGVVYNGIPGWGLTISATNIFKALDGEAKNFHMIYSGSSAGLDGAIIRAYERQEPILSAYYGPTPLLGRYDMVRLESEHDPVEWARCTAIEDCPDPKPNDWIGVEIKTIVTSAFNERAPKPVLEYLSHRSWDNATVNALMAWMVDNQAEGDVGARYFLKNNPDLWKKWVSEEVAAKIEAAL